MEINRYLRKDRITKNDMVPIRLVVHYDNRRLPISTGEKVHKNGWDEDKNRVNGKQPFYLQINQKLNDMEAVLTVIYREAQHLQIELTENSYREAFQAVYEKLKDSGGDYRDDKIREAYVQFRKPATEEVEMPHKTKQKEPLLLEAMAQWIEAEKQQVNMRTGRKRSENTIKGLNSTYQRFEKFEEATGLRMNFGLMDKNFYSKFKQYMLITLKQDLNTFSKHISRLKQFLGWVEDHHENIYVNSKYHRWQAPIVHKGVQALEPDELRTIRDLNFHDSPIREELSEIYQASVKSQPTIEGFEAFCFHVDLARDYLLLCAYTGLRIGDALRLRRGEINGEMIVTDANKTDGRCYIPFYNDELSRPVELVAKYTQLVVGDRVLPFYSDVMINRYLKHVQQLAKINRINLTTKIGRKTFATLKMYQGVPSRVIMQATGHKTESSFNRYVGINQEELMREFKSRAPAL